MRIASKFILILLLVCFLGCENSTQTKTELFQTKTELLTLTMKRDTVRKPFRYHTLDIEPDGKVVFILETYDAFNTTQKFESQLSEEKVKELINEVKKANFYSFEKDYSQESGNCNQWGTDSPSVIFTIKINETEKTVNHYYGCWISSWFSDENALQPLTDLGNKIDEIVETKRWIGEQK